jgi:hypothetical protein
VGWIGRRGVIAVLAGVLTFSAAGSAAGSVKIVPGESVGPVMFTMSRAEVIAALGAPAAIFYGDAVFTAKDSPNLAWYSFPQAGLSMLFLWDTLMSVAVVSDAYEYPGGVRVGMTTEAATKVLGPLPDDSFFLDGSTQTSGHMVYGTGPAAYRLASYEGDNGNVALKIDEKTGVVTGIRLRVSSLGLFLPTDLESDDPVSPGDARDARSREAAALASQGIAQESYVVITRTAMFRTEGGADAWPGGPTPRHFYVLRSGTAAQTEASQARVVALAVRASSAPLAKDLVSACGLPSLVYTGTDSSASAVVGELAYGTVMVMLAVDGKTVQRVEFGPFFSDLVFEGSIRVGSTAEQVYAALGAPIARAPAARAAPGEDRVLYSNGLGANEWQTIWYADRSLELSIQHGVVSWISRRWM